MASLILAGAGSVIGGAVGGPWGARIGWAAGAAIGNRFGQRGQVSRGPRLNDTRIQASTWGEPIPIVYGTYRLSCNLIWSGGIREVVTRTRNRGKGGPSSTTETYTYFADAAFALCEGEIVGIRRIWANGQLIYNAGTDANVETLIESNQVSTLFALYTGSETQLPSSIIEGYKGAGNVPAYRGLAYIVFQNLALAPYGNALPNFEFEIVTAGSISLSEWQALAAPAFGVFRWVAGNAGRLVALQNVQYIYTSDDFGATWTFQATLPVTIGANSIGFGGGTWVAPCNASTQVFTSTDNGDTWVLRTVASPGSWYAHAYGNGLHVVNATNTTRNLTSPDGINWTIQTGYPFAHLVSAIVFGNGRFVSIASNGQGAWTTDGISWTGFTLPTGAVSIAYGNGLFVVAINASFPGTANYATSTDGETWITRTMPAVRVWRSVQFGLGTWLMLGTETSYISETGIDGWVEAPTAIGSARSWNTYTAFSAPYFVAMHLGSQQDAQRYAVYNVITANAVPVAGIVADQFSRSGLSAAQYDTASVTDFVTGYAITRIASARDNIEPLQDAFFFDAVESGDELKLVKRGGAISTFIPDDDLGAHALGAEPPASVTITRAQEVDLPSRVSVRYANALGDYLPAVEQSRRIVGESRQEVLLELPIALTPNQAATIADVQMYNAYIARTRYAFSTSIKYAKYEPGDIVGLPLDAGTARARIVRSESSGPQINFEAVGDDALVYLSAAVGGTQQASQTQITLPPLSNFLPLDIPILRDQDDDASLYIVITPAVDNGTWRGAELYQSADNAAWELTGQVFQVAAVGTCSTTLADWPGGNINDETTSVEVVLTSGDLETVTFPQFLNGGLRLRTGSLGCCAAGSGQSNTSARTRPLSAS
jgi:hypothetical protein